MKGPKAQRRIKMGMNRQGSIANMYMVKIIPSDEQEVYAIINMELITDRKLKELCSLTSLRRPLASHLALKGDFF